MQTNNLKHTLNEFRVGILSGFPFCCVVNYCLDALFHKEDRRIKRHISGLGHRGYVPCVLCMKARKQTYQRAITEMFLENGFLEDKDYPLLPEHVKAMVINPPQL